MNASFKRWGWRLASLLAFATLSVALLHPALAGLATPWLDLLAALGLDGIVLLIEVQLAVGLLSWLRGRFGPWLTRGWNRRLAPRLGRPPSDDLLAAIGLGGCHWLLRHGGRVGLRLYLAYLAVGQWARSAQRR